MAGKFSELKSIDLEQKKQTNTRPPLSAMSDKKPCVVLGAKVFRAKDAIHKRLAERWLALEIEGGWRMVSSGMWLMYSDWWEVCVGGGTSKADESTEDAHTRMMASSLLALSRKIAEGEVTCSTKKNDRGLREGGLFRLFQAPMHGPNEISESVPDDQITALTVRNTRLFSLQTDPEFTLMRLLL